MSFKRERESSHLERVENNHSDCFVNSSLVSVRELTVSKDELNIAKCYNKLGVREKIL